MCRLLAAHLTSGPGPLPEIIRAFLKACTRDELHPRKSGHRDGWGWLIVTPEHITHYRTVKPADEDRRGFAALAKAVDDVGEGFVITHCRRASKKMKKSLLTSHPVPQASLSSTYAEVWVAFNGTIPLERLGWAGGSGYVTDTHLIASVITKHVSMRGPRQGLTEGLRAIASSAGKEHGAVVATIAMVDDSARAAFLNHYPLKDPGLKRYYRAMALRDRGAFITASPTVALYHGGDWYELGEDEIVDLGEVRLRVDD